MALERTGRGRHRLRADGPARLSPRSTRYIPVDIVDRGPGTILTDLNRDCLPPLPTRTAAVLGVVEYVIDLPRLFTQLRQFDRVVLSYNHASIQDMLWALGMRRKRVIWLHRHGPLAFARLIERAGWHITRRHRVRMGRRSTICAAAIPLAIYGLFRPKSSDETQ
jgi:hypothetical protein